MACYLPCTACHPIVSCLSQVSACGPAKVITKRPGADIGFTWPIRSIVCLVVPYLPIVSCTSRAQTCGPIKFTADCPGVDIGFTWPIWPVVCLEVASCPIAGRPSWMQMCRPARVMAKHPGTDVALNTIPLACRISPLCPLLVVHRGGKLMESPRVRLSVLVHCLPPNGLSTITDRLLQGDPIDLPWGWGTEFPSVGTLP